MSSGELLTTGRAAQLCCASQRALNNWIREGRVKAYRTPGGHYRIRLLDLEQFLGQHGKPPLEEPPPVPAGETRVLVVDDDGHIVQVMTGLIAQLGGIEVATASNGFEALQRLDDAAPDVVLVELSAES